MHVFLNILLGILAVLITMSKWRIFAVRRRYLLLNLKSNLVDLIVGLSIVILTYFAGHSLLPVDFLLMVIYVLWLLVLKPMSSEVATLAQSLVAVFLGISASTIMTASIDPIFAVVLAFLIGYAASRHVLSQTGGQNFTLTTLVCGLVAIILSIFAFIYNYARQAMYKYQEDFRFRDILGPVLFGIVLVGIIVICFSNPIFNI